MLPSKIRTIQTTFFGDRVAAKKRKSNPEVLPKNSSSLKIKSTMSASESLLNNGGDAKDGEKEVGDNSTPEKIVTESTRLLGQENESNCVRKDENGKNDDGKNQKHSTSTFDDGYESYNSTPLQGSGYAKSGKHSSSTLALTTPKKNLHVQLEEDEKRGYETFALSTSSSQAEVDLNSPHLPDDNRETWTSNADFLLSIIGFAVDLANVWRFPYLCYRNGGGAFLIPYFLMLIFGAVPLFYMELVLGQFNRQGPVSVWRICPLFKGVGFCAVLVAFYVSFYYNVIIAWSLYFLGTSFSMELPWIHCNNTWNSVLCWDKPYNHTIGNDSLSLGINEMKRHTPAAEYFTRSVLEIQHSEGLSDMGYPKWQLVLCLLAVYCTLYISLFKGVKSSGKVVWVTATMPYVVLSILLVRGLMLPGALKGISYYLNPELSKLKETQVWLDAAVQIFYSVGAGFGVHLSYASYNTFHNNCLKDCLVTTAVNSFTSFFSGFVIFTYLGYMSHKQQVPISSVAAEGPGLVFQVYPEAVATLPGSHVWSVLFFFMLIMLGLDSGMGGLECVITGLMDEFNKYFKWKRAREIFTLIVITMSFCVALVNITPGGIYMFHLFDTYSAGISLLCSALFESIAVSWFYGLDRFTQDIKAMLGSTPGPFWRICWKFISPLFIIGVVVFGLAFHEPLRYIDYIYPSWAEWVGWCLTLSSVLMIPLVAVIQLIRTPGTFKERLAICISPEEEHEQLRESRIVSRFKAKHWLFV
ncbi:sodium-dependent dopamine transporter-like [Onthophagus taurus]|uniref:sodium-dependent dopamine transporter-like n=1 Tax=Onthophagus taurus TaxID=166361 RepID=UPI000C20AC02|nr:sodium-dependent dopamine transporter-like [Onthophagus taurus]